MVGKWIGVGCTGTHARMHTYMRVHPPHPSLFIHPPTCTRALIPCVFTLAHAHSMLAGGMIQTLTGIIRNEGPRALYTGCLPALVGMAPAGSIFYGVFDLLKHRQVELVRARRVAEGCDDGSPIHLEAISTLMVNTVSERK